MEKEGKEGHVRRGKELALLQWDTNRTLEVMHPLGTFYEANKLNR